MTVKTPNPTASAWATAGKANRESGARRTAIPHPALRAPLSHWERGRG
jgi:hypothetical protein